MCGVCVVYVWCVCKFVVLASDVSKLIFKKD